MAQRLILHVGAPKTGTTYLQQLLWSNADVLAREGIHLPLDRQGQLAASADLRQAPWAGDHVAATWQDLAVAVDAVEGTALVSEELLCRTDPSRIAAFVGALAAGTSVEVVYGARDPGRQVPAMWQHAVRARNSVTFEGYLQWLRDDPGASYWLEQDPVLAIERWGGSGRFHVLTVPPSGSAPDLLWRRFAGILGVDPGLVTPPPAPANESLGVVEAEILRRLNSRLGDRFPLWRPYVRAVRRHVILPALATSPSAERIRVPAAFAGWLEERAQESVEVLRSREVSVAGDLDELCLPVEPASVTAGELTDAQLLDAVLDAWIRQLERLPEPPGPTETPKLAERVRGRISRMRR